MLQFWRKKLVNGGEGVYNEKGKNFLSNHQKGIFVEYVSFLQEKPESRGKRRGGGKRKEFSDAG